MNCLRNLANMTLQRLPVKQANQRNQTIKQRDSSALEQVKILTLSAAEPASRALAVHSRGSERREVLGWFGLLAFPCLCIITLTKSDKSDQKRMLRIQRPKI